MSLILVMFLTADYECWHSWSKLVSTRIISLLGPLSWGRFWYSVLLVSLVAAAVLIRKPEQEKGGKEVFILSQGQRS